MEEAYVYCIPLDETSVKIGSHLGSLQKLDASYSRAVNRERLAQKIFFRIEPAYRLHVERVIQLFLKRIDKGALFIEKEKFKKEAAVLFKSYALQFGLRLEDIENNDVPNNEEAQEIAEVIKRLKIAQHEQRILKIKKLENEKKEAEAQEREALERKQREEEEEERKAAAVRDDPYIEYRQAYIVIDHKSAIKWAELRESFRSWYHDTHDDRMYGRCDEVKKYFISKLGAEKQSSLKNYKLRGFFGYRLLSSPTT